jgi:zinc protease
VDKAADELRTRPPTPGEIIAFTFPRFEHFHLPSGLEVYLASIDRGPLVSLHLACPGGGKYDSPSDAGRATLAADLLDEGTDELTAMEIAARVESLGGSLSGQAGWDAGWLSISLLSRHLEAGLDLLAHMVERASFPEAEVDRLCQQRLAELRRRISQPASLAADALARAVYPGTPYGQSLLGTPDSVRTFGRSELYDFHRRHVTPRGSVLIVTGDLDSTAAAKLIERVFGGWSGSEPAAAEPILNHDPHRTSVTVVDRPEAAQTVLRIGHASVPRTHPDYGALQVLNSLLGGKFTSRINLSLREELGITYGASSGFSARLGPGPFQVAADVETDGVGIGTQEIIKQLHRLQDELVGAAELQDTKTYLLGVFPYSLQRIDGLASLLADLGVASLPDDYFDQQLEMVRGIESTTIRSLAELHLRPTRLAIVAVGPADKLRPQLERFGPVAVVRRDNEVETGDDPG